MCVCVSPLHAVLIQKYCLVPGGGGVGVGATGMGAGGRPGAKERGHIHIHRVGHAHVNHF